MPPKPRAKPVVELLGDGVEGKLVLLGIQRDENLMYYLKQGDVWATPRKMPGQPSRPAFVVARG